MLRDSINFELVRSMHYVIINSLCDLSNCLVIECHKFGSNYCNLMLIDQHYLKQDTTNI